MDGNASACLREQSPWASQDLHGTPNAGENRWGSSKAQTYEAASVSHQTFSFLKNKTGGVLQAGILQDRLIILSGTTIHTIPEQKLSMKQPSREESMDPWRQRAAKEPQRASLQFQAGSRGAAARENIPSTGTLNGAGPWKKSACYSAPLSLTE